MRLLNIKFSIPDKKIDQSISLVPGENIIQTGDEYMKKILPQLPLIAIYGRGSRSVSIEDIFPSENCSVAIEAENSGEQTSFIYENGSLKNDRLNTQGLISFDDFLLYSYFAPAYMEGELDPALRSEGLKKFLIRREPDYERSGHLHNLDGAAAEKEKEINELKKKRELLELKKRKKDKLIKELSTSDRELGRLRRKREAYSAYRETLAELLDLIQEETKLSSKIVNLKKDIIEIREASEKRELLEKDIARRFPQFTRGMIEMLPDLDRLQDEFNSIRDINEELEKFDFDKKKKISLSLKGITGGLLFAFISMMFILFKSISLGTVTGILLGTISSVLVLLSAATGYYLHLLIRKSYPDELLKRKKEIESALLEVFSSENFPHKNFATGELYEYLFQYFEDFLVFRELQNELSAIKKGAGSRSTLKEREEKLNSLAERKDSVQQDIETKLGSLDSNVHPVPERENIKNLIPEIDEMITEILREEEYKDSIAKKIGNETMQYESGEKSQKTIDDTIAVIDADINKLKNDIKDISFMQKVYDETSDKWFSGKLSLLARRCSDIYGRIAEGTKKDAKLQDSVRDLVMTGKSGNFTPEELAALGISMKLVLAEISPPAVNYPLILIEPLTFFKPEIADKLKKILLELSKKRQVVIITSKSENNLAGNLINI